MVKQRLVKIVAKNSNGDDNDRAAISHHEYITAAEESTDDDGSITYVEDYEINENGDDDDGAFFGMLPIIEPAIFIFYTIFLLFNII